MVEGGFLGALMGCFGLRGLLIIRGAGGLEVGGMQSRLRYGGVTRSGD
jgi:hypothetical protein